MTTDLTGDFELGEDEFDWDVFLPDSAETDVEDTTGTLEYETDESDFDWDGALLDDAEPQSGDDGARAGAAYDRIVDTVRRSFEDEPSAQAETEPEQDRHPSLGADDEAEASRTTEREPVLSEFAAPFEGPVDSEADAGPVAAWAPAAVSGPDAEPDPVLELEPESTWTAEDGREPAGGFVEESGFDAASYAGPEAEPAAGEEDPELDHWLALDDDPSLAGTEPVPVAFEPAPESEPAAPHFAEAAATFAVVGAAEPAQPPLSDDAAWATWEAGPPPEFVPDPAEGGSGEARPEKPKRSRVFKATVALAVIFLVAVGAVVAVRALHHPTTTAAPLSRVTTPTQAAKGTGSSAGTAASDTARVQAATDAVDSATTAASVGLTSLTAFPTPTNVETVINPYISSLQLYQTFLSGTKVPPSAQPAAAAAAAKIRQDLQFLETIDGLPPQQLGAFLAQFDTDTTQLQTTLSTLEQDLRAPAS